MKRNKENFDKLKMQKQRDREYNGKFTNRK